MSRTIEIEVFQFDELTDEAKERARNWLRELEASDFDPCATIEDAQAVAKILGIEFDSKPVKLMGGGIRYDPKIWYSGFGCQGDGACFEGRYAYAKGASRKIREYAPHDETLHAIADQLQSVQRRAAYGLTARVTHGGHYYYHEGCTQIDVEHVRDWASLPESCANVIRDELRRFMRWIYRQLESEYEYCMSDEAIDDTIRINEYEFEASGKRAPW